MYAMVIGMITQQSKQLTASKVQDLSDLLPLAQDMWSYEIKDAETFG
jgi:hypothetical protein